MYISILNDHCFLMGGNYFILQGYSVMHLSKWMY